MSDIRQYMENWQDERNSAYLYQQLADIEKDPRLAGIYSRFVKVEMDHADKWVEKLKAEGVAVPEFKPAFRTRVLSALARRFGPGMVLPTMQVMEQKGVKSYKSQGAEAGMVSDEASHANLINKISLSSIKGGMEGGTLAMLEGRHRSTGGNALRAAVLGANDGMVSNLSLVMGVAGASMNNKAILIAGLAGLLAGAFSMALGEWLSVQSSRELYQNQIEIERKEIKANPQEEAAELALIYESRGLKKDQAKILASQILTDQNSAIDTLAREELGIDPGELGGSPWEASITSFSLFAVGAVVPVIPFLLLNGITAVIVSVILSTIGLFILGAIITIFTGQPVLKSGLRMVIFSLLAAAATFGIGRLIGGSIGL
ncbi:MAG TPA: VIT1/CCC1 family protein [Anaerolineaceae bacterium]|nr:VIT1/CCC1 family protein [Anaerolineaceae bacterium]